MSTNDDWKIRVEYAIRTFRSPFVEDIRLSSIATDRELSYLAGQTLAAECLNLQAALTEAREVIGFYADELHWLRARVEGRWDISFGKDDGAKARAFLAKYGESDE